jgi:uncharacterized protein YeaO (DUF488 family)
VNLVLDTQLIKTKSISDKIEASDGLRFLVVSPILGDKVLDKHTYFDCLNELIPSDNLLRKWKDRKIVWSEFALEYKKELDNPEAQKKLEYLRSLVNDGQTITLLCWESEWRSSDCHRSILSDVLMGIEREYDQHLDMTIAEILSRIPRQKRLVDQQLLEGQLELVTKDCPKHCYYCKKRDF